MNGNGNYRSRRNGNDNGQEMMPTHSDPITLLDHVKDFHKALDPRRS